MTERERDTHTERERETHTQRETHTESERHVMCFLQTIIVSFYQRCDRCCARSHGMTERERDTHRERERERETDRDRQTVEYDVFSQTIIVSFIGVVIIALLGVMV